MTQAAELLKYFGASSGFGPPYAQYAPAVARPPEGSDLIEEWEFFYEMARQLGLLLQLVGFYGWGRHLESPSVVVQLDMRTRPSTDQLYALLTTGSRVPLDTVKRYPHGHVFDEVRDVVHPRDPGCETRLELGNPDMLRELAEVAADDWSARHSTPELPFRLVPRRSNQFVNSTGRSLEALTRGKPWNPAFLNPDDLRALGLETGDLARIRSRHDEILGIVEADASLRSGVVSMTHGFGALPSEDEDPREAGANTGRLLRADDDYDPVSGIPRMGALPVAVERV
jgi:anaerobic selenocysteine-containing dehydrogenase